MLTLKEGELTIIHLSPDADPSMTVAELFKDGPIEVKIGATSPSQVKFCIEVPRALIVVSEELETV